MSIKIIELTIDEDLDSDVRVDEIALVLNPAIETQFLYFNKEGFVKPSPGENEDDFIGRCMGVLLQEGKDQDQAYAICKSMWDERFNEEEFESYDDYPEAVKETAQKVIRWVEENGWGSCGTDVGKQRANQLAKGEPISLETIKRMYSYLSRHKVDLESSKSYDDGCGKLMYDAWGGEPGLRWSERKIKQLEEMNADSPCDCGCDDKDELYFGECTINGCKTYNSIEDFGVCNVEIKEVIEEIIEDKGEELEDLLEQGWEIIDVKYVDTEEVLSSAKNNFSKLTKEEFYSIITKPGEQSFLDATDGSRKTRFVYMVGFGANIIPTSRGFCKRMFGGRQFVFRFEDIMILNAQIAGEPDNMKIIPRPKGTEVDIFTYKGGANCRHLWWEITLMPPVPDGEPVRATNNKRRMLEDASYKGPAAAQAGQVNPPVDYGSRVSLSEDKVLPKGFIQGLPVFEMKKDAEKYSTDFGCGGIVEEVDYMGKKMYQSCSYKKKDKGLQFSVDNEKRMIYSPAMKPGILIPRLDDMTGEMYFVTFTKETIEIMSQRFLIDKRTDKTNYEHSDKKFEDVFLVESWIVSGEKDKAYELGFTEEQIPKGTWMVGYRIDNDDVWKMIKSGKVKGLSIEGNFQYNIPKPDFSEDDIKLEEVINILKEYYRNDLYF